jgi:hypothetical protein
VDVSALRESSECRGTKVTSQVRKEHSVHNLARHVQSKEGGQERKAPLVTLTLSGLYLL